MSLQVQEPGNIVLRARTDLKVSPRTERGRPFHFIEDPIRNKFYRLGPSEYAVFRACDGRRTLAEAVICALSDGERDSLNREQALVLAKWLVESGLATTEASESVIGSGSRATRCEAGFLQRCNPLFLRTTLGCPDRLLRRFDSWGRLLRSRAFFAVWLAGAIAGGIVVLTHWTSMTEHSPLSLGWRGAAQLLVIWCLLKIVHEAAHALACRSVGGTVGETGLVFILGIPSPFVDVSSVWRQESRRARMFVSLAGVYVETFVASIAVLVWVLVDDEVVRQLALATALLAGATTLVFNLNPLMRFDGYFVLSDWTDVSNLASRANTSLRRWAGYYLLGLPGDASNRTADNEPRWLAAYGAASLAWRMVVLIGLASLVLYKLGPWVAALAIGVPAAVVALRQMCNVAAVFSAQRRAIDVRRTAASWGTIAVVSGVAFYLFDPRTISVAAVVEYEPLEVVRAAAPGFVAESYVSDGDAVVAGQPLLRLENRALISELEQARWMVQQHLAKARMHRQAGTVAKEQAELRLRDAAEAKLTHLARRFESLTVCAPGPGKIVSRGTRLLTGRWIAEGEEIILIGDDCRKQIVAALPQSADAALRDAEQSYTATLNGSGRTVVIPRLFSEPRAACEVLHPALSVDNGGEVPVRRRKKTDRGSDGEQTVVAEFHQPHFRLEGDIRPEDATTLLAGRTASLEFHTTWRGVAAQWWSRVERWMDAGDASVGVVDDPNAI